MQAFSLWPLSVWETSSEMTQQVRMAVHPLTTSHVWAFIEALVEWSEAPWATTVDMPFVIIGYTNKTVIVDLRFQIDVLKVDLVLMTDPVIRRILWREGVECAIVLWWDMDQGPEEALQ